MRRILLSLATSVAIAAAPAVSAGQYNITRVSFKTTATHDQKSTSVWVRAAAEYMGELDLDDEQWALETDLIALGSVTKGSKTGNGIPADRKIDNEPATSYGATRTIPNCKPLKPTEPHIYFGKAVVAIYHQGDDPDVDHSDDYVRGESNCPSSTDSGENQGPDGDAGGEPDPGQGPTTPIIIDLDRAGFELTGPHDGVSFDIDGDGEAESISWTALHSGDGWLSLDRNGNGLIDDGSELFGNFTDQPASEQPHGYLALAVFDGASEGGDDNGIIDDRDLIFDQLRVWIDSNQDGVSQPDELLDLRSAGVEWLETRPVSSHRRDRNGNELRYQALVRLSRAMSHSADAFLVTGP